MLTYKSRSLTLTAPKTGGKNQSTVDGFYTDTAGNEYFIKKPADTRELFTELFAGLLLQEFMNRNLIARHYHASLICADIIQFEDGSYGLIQPKIAFTELYKKIGTATRNGTDRDPLWEMFAGPQYYPVLTQQGQYFGLATALMFSLLLGDYSVHSGNVVCLPVNEDLTQHARIDWGAAFRYFAHPDNNNNILNPYEYDGRFNIKAFTKGFISNYKNISGLFPAIARKADDFSKKITHDTLLQLVNNALGKIPTDMLSQEIRAQLASYMHLESFRNACCADKNGNALFAEEFTNILLTRLDKIAELKEISTNTVDLYQSTIDGVLSNTQLTNNTKISFGDLITDWHAFFSITPNIPDIDLCLIDTNDLADQFNRYLEQLIKQTEACNLWDYNGTNTHNILASLYTGTDKAQSGHAFIGQYRESTILQRLFRINPQTKTTSRFVPYEIPTEKCTNPHWNNLITLLTAGVAIINLIEQINKIKTIPELAVEIKPSLISLQKQIIIFHEYHKELEDDFLTMSTPEHHHTFDSDFFYPVDMDTLHGMHADQLATICLEEIDSSKPGTLIQRIMIEQSLRESMLPALHSGRFNMRADNPANKINMLSEWGIQFSIFSTQLAIYADTKAFPAKKLLLADIHTFYEQSPLCLQHAYHDILKKIQSKFEIIQEKHDILGLYQSKSQAIAETTSLANKIKLFDSLDIIFQTITTSQIAVNLDSHRRLEANNSAYQTILLKNICTDAHVIDEAKVDLINWLASLELLDQKIFDKIIENTETLQCIMKSSSQMHPCRDLLDAAFSDNILWSALCKTNNRQLSPLLMQDLLSLKKFTDNNLAKNQDNQLGNTYSSSLQDFYHNALDIRLSSKPLPEQVSLITLSARNFFNHRHLPLRLLADALLCISLLGLSVLIARKAMGKTFFFSSDSTAREQSLNNHLNDMHVHKADENADETGRISAPGG